MQELTTLINALGAFLSKFGILGWFVLFIGILLWKGKSVFDWIANHILKNLFPLWHEKRKFRIEEERQSIEDARKEREYRLEEERKERTRQVEKETRERVDTIMVWKDVVLESRKRLDDYRLEINKMQGKVFDVVAQNERLNAQVLESLRDYKAQNERLSTQTIEVLRDVSSVLRAQTDRLNRMNGLLSKGEN